MGKGFTELDDLYRMFLQHPVVCTDSRSVPAGSIFFALRGENFNGNLYAKRAINAGAAYAVVDDPSLNGKNRFLLVADVLTTLQLLASKHRQSLGIPVIAIGGSNGKTTTRELVHAVLAKKFRVSATKGNLNNHIGVPLTLLGIARDAEIAVVEIGANHLGETASLAELVRPTHGLVTNNGLDHLEGFGSEKNVRIANGELYKFLLSSR
jgi:UDP-N-acetylmuramoyl-tripeptide--D-alanyl-D-alanine ligase